MTIAGASDDRVSMYRASAERADRSDRIARWLLAGALVVVTVACVVIMAWSGSDIGNEVKQIQVQQSALHSDTIKHDDALACQSGALNLILTELAQAQQAQVRHRPPPVFTFPKPC